MDDLIAEIRVDVRKSKKRIPRTGIQKPSFVKDTYAHSSQIPAVLL